MNVFVNTQKHIQTRAIAVHVCDFISKFRWYSGEVYGIMRIKKFNLDIWDFKTILTNYF